MEGGFRLHEQETGGVSDGGDYAAKKVGTAWYAAYGPKPDCGYCREQCVFKNIEEHRGDFCQNMSTFMSLIPRHSPSERHPVSTMASINRHTEQI